MGCCALKCKKCGVPQELYEEPLPNGKGYRVVETYSCRDHRYGQKGRSLQSCEDCGAFGYGNCRHVWSYF